MSRLEIHCAPKQGGHFNVAEIETEAMRRQCLNLRTLDRAAISQETAAWAECRNRECATLIWRIKTADARIRLKSLHP